MTDSTLNRFLAYGTDAQRLAFTPTPPTPASGPSQAYVWWTTDTKLLWVYDTGWEQFSTIGSALTLTGLISPTSLSTDQNNYNPSGFATCSIMRLTASGAVNITGLTAPSTGGQVILVANIGSNTITLKNESASSTAANRFDLTADLALAASAACLLFYDATSARWRASGGAGGGGGGGTVTSVATGTGLTGGTITTTGTLDLAAVTAHKLFVGTGSAGAPGTVAVGATNTLLHGNTGADPTFSAVVTADITDANVTLAKIANAAASSKLLGSGATGSGSAYVELSLGTGLSMSGTTLNASGTVSSVALALPSYFTVSGSPVTTSGTLTAVLAAPLVQPQGRLTLTSNTPVMTADVTAATSVYYAPYVGGRCPVWDGSEWVLLDISSQLTMSLDTTNQPTTQVFDLFVYNSSGSAAIGCGPAWINTATVTWTSASPGVCSWTGHGLSEGAPVIFTAGTATPTGITAGTVYYVQKSPGANSFSVATSIANAAAGTYVNTSSTGTGTQTGTNHTSVRGTGAGTTELQLKNGIWTNKNSITLTNGAGAGTAVSANQATYVGSFYTTAAGQTGVQFNPTTASGGTNTIVGLWNGYNQITQAFHNSESAGPYTATSATWKPQNGSVGNRITVIDGLGTSPATFTSYAFTTESGGEAAIGIIRNATNVAPNIYAINRATGGLITISIADFASPLLGLSYYQVVIADTIASGTGTYYNGGGVLYLPT